MSEFPINVKCCTKCHETKPVTDFTKQTTGKYGVRSTCKICSAAWSKEWVKANPDSVRASVRKWQKANPDSVRASTLKWREANPEKVRASTFKWQKANPEKVRAKALQWQKANPERHKASKAKWYRENEQKAKAIAAAWYKDNPNRVRENTAKWREANPDKVMASNANRKAAKLQRTPAWVDPEAIKKIYADCANRRAQGEDVNVDHIIPLQGELVSGLHVAENLRIIPATENFRKNNKFDPLTWTDET